MGFSAARDSSQSAVELNHTTPNSLMLYYRHRRTRRTPEIMDFIRLHFPSVAASLMALTVLGRCGSTHR